MSDKLLKDATNEEVSRELLRRGRGGNAFLLAYIDHSGLGTSGAGCGEDIATMLAQMIERYATGQGVTEMQLPSKN